VQPSQPTLRSRLSQAEARVEKAPHDWKSWEALYVAWAQIGDVRAAGVALQRCTELAPATANIHTREVQFHLGNRDYDASFQAIRRLIESEPKDHERLELGLRVAGVAGETDFVQRWALELARVAPDRCAISVRALMQISAFQTASDLIEERLSSHSDDGKSWALRAELELWAAAWSAAEISATRALSESPDDPLARMVLGACALHRGEPKTALSHLQMIHPESRPTVPSIEPSTLWCWISLAHHAAGDLNAAGRAAQRAMQGGGPPSFSARLVRTKIGMLQQLKLSAARRKQRRGQESDPLKRISDIWSYREILERLEPLLEEPDRPWSGIVGDLQEALDQAIKALGGNLSPTPSRADQSTALPQPFEPSPLARAEARQLQHLLRSRPVSEVIGRFTQLQEQHPDAVTPYTYKGEVLMWFGRTEEARTVLKEAIAQDITTQWAWIGLGGCALLEGQPKRAIEVFEEGIEMCRYRGPTMFSYRAEAWLALGELERARSDIDTALSAKPQRMSAWVTRALINYEQGDSALAENLIEKIRCGSPHLWQHLASRSDALGPRLREILRAMRGNRSSSLPFFFTSSSSDPAFLRWNSDIYRPLLDTIPALAPKQPQRWIEQRPEICHRGNCGPSCIGRQDLQAWIGPSVALVHWLRKTGASDGLCTHARSRLMETQAQRRRGCPDLVHLAQGIRHLLQAIASEELESPELDRLCKRLRDLTRDTG
jgi:tetratricopeptide (TPR) repeat protein